MNLEVMGIPRQFLVTNQSINMRQVGVMGLFDSENSYIKQFNSFKRSGVTLGIVLDLKDPLGKNRVRCTYLTGDDDAGTSDWAHVVSPFGGNGHGVFFFPNVGDIVLLAFEEGDIHMPYVIGSVWKNEIAPPVVIDKDDPKNQIFSITTPNNNSIELYDEEKKEKITLKTPLENSIVMDDENKKISIGDKEGNNSIVMDIEKGAISINCAKKLSINVGSVSIEIDGENGDLNIKAGRIIKLDAAQLNIKSSGSAEVSSTGELTLKSSASTNVKGIIVKIN